MATDLNRFEGYAAAPTPDAEAGPWIEFLSQFDGFFFLFCTMALLYVVMSQYARHRRRRKNLEKMRAQWRQQNAMRDVVVVGNNPKLRYDQGFWGDGG